MAITENLNFDKQSDKGVSKNFSIANLALPTK